MELNIKNIKKEFRSRGIFYSQNDMAIFLKSFFPENINEIYDPTCGCGNLLKVFNDNVQKYGQEINNEELEKANARLTNFYGVCGDTLVEPAFFNRKFKYIVANPPFSINWQPKLDERFKDLPTLPPRSKADYAFILHCLYLLSNDGIAVILNFPGVLYRGNSEGKIRQWLVEKNYISDVVHVAGNKFVDTKIPTCILILKKNKKTTDINFFDSENDLKRQVSYEEIKENSFNLSVSNYIQKEEEKEVINPFELQKKARLNFKELLRKELMFDKTICELDFSLSDFKNYCNELVLLIKNIKKQTTIQNHNVEYPNNIQMQLDLLLQRKESEEQCN